MAAPAAPGLTKVGAAQQILHGIGAPVNNRTVGAMVGWMNAEGGNWNNSAAHNPLNTTQGASGSQSINSVGVKAYPDWNTGIQATVQTLKNGHYGGIIQAFHNSDPQGVINAIAGSPWGTSGNTVRQTISAAIGQSYNLGNTAGIAQAMASPSPSVTSTGPTSTTDTNQALIDSMLHESASPVNTSGKVTVKNPLADAASLISSGNYTTNTPALTSLKGVQQQSITASAFNAAASAGAGPDAQKLLGMIHSVIGGSYNQGNHAAIGESAQQVKARGTDCSGFVSWLMGPAGLGIWNTSLATPDIANAPGMQSGKGSTITVWNNKQPGNAGHVFIQIGNQFFASEGGVGIRQISSAEAQNYIAHGSDGGTYEALHPKGL